MANQSQNSAVHLFKQARLFGKKQYLFPQLKAMEFQSIYIFLVESKWPVSDWNPIKK